MKLGHLLFSCMIFSSLFLSCPLVDPISASPHNVIYDGNGMTSGTVPTDANEYTKGTSVIVLGNPGSLSKTGYNFGGWSTKADNTGTTYAVGSALTMGNEDVTLYAVWLLSFDGTWSGVIANTTYTAISFTVSDSQITGTTTITFPFNNVTITNFLYSNIPITADNSFSYASGSVSSNGGRKVFTGTFSGTTPGNRTCTGTASYDENSYLQTAHMTYTWTGSVQ